MIQNRLLSLLGLCFSLGCASSFAGPVIVLDPGHGGQLVAGKTDSSQIGDGASWNNATAADGKTLEKALTLSFTKAVRSALQADARAKSLGLRVVLTRDDDSHLGAMERAAVAVRENADVFLSIHFNASDNHKAEGTRSYYLAADHVKWEYMHFLNPYASRDKSFCSLVTERVAKAFQPLGGKYEQRLVAPDSDDRKDGLRMLGYVRQDTHLPNVAVGLLEVEFIDNPKVVAWLLGPRQAEAEKAAARAVAAAIFEWLEKPAKERDVVSQPRQARSR